ncbi:hypothetical protein QBC35DRAFT_478155 [Podospora australis]|uniref:WD-like domain-containing protein n=1 Tax=Podospora australis TaxID=1536484 RepID=A0AAN6WJU3_9PEZI|nr:hypothetical protein QBC35DRAFT_478155 [Podospora australis]
MLSKIFTTAALFAALGMAVPAPGDKLSNGMILLAREADSSGGHLEFWGYAEGHEKRTTEAEASLERRACGGNIVSCYTSNVPDGNAVQNLLYELQNFQGTVPQAPRSVCRETNGKLACASWSTDVGSIRPTWLYSAAAKTRDQCVTKGQSGRAREVNLGGKCTSQCLSNRRDGC